MGVVQHAVADRVGQHCIREVVVPLRRRQLARDEGRAIAAPILEDLEDIPALLVSQRRQGPRSSKARLVISACCCCSLHA